MKKIISLLVLMLFTFIISISAQEICEYNGLKTEYGYNYQTPGAKAEYADEQFVHLMDAKTIKELGQIKGLTCLEYADFYSQGISGNLESLKDLTSLKVLSLHTNPEIQGDVCVFSKALKLKSLKLAFDEQVYGDISCLKELNLETLAMTYTKISGDLSDLSQMTNLKALYLSGTDVAGDISALSGLTNLEELTLSDSAGDGSNFYGDLTSLDNLKKLKRVAIYNTKATNCEHFHEVHPDIEGGCSEKSKSTVVNTNLESEKLIGKGGGDIQNGDQSRDSKDSPPEECLEQGIFIGEEKCRALVGEKSSGSSENGPPKECIINGKFIGREECEAMMKAPTRELPAAEPEAKPQETKGFLQRVIDWFRSLFS